MKIIEDVRKYAAEQGSRRERSVEKGNKKEKCRELTEKGSEVYAKA